VPVPTGSRDCHLSFPPAFPFSNLAGGSRLTKAPGWPHLARLDTGLAAGETLPAGTHLDGTSHN
jgi:hypothetical protein